MKVSELMPKPAGHPSEPAYLAPIQELADDVRQPTAHRYGWYIPFKAACDRIGAVLLLIIAAPIILICAVAVMLTSRGSAFYCQRRVGKAGREFTLIKLRTMRLDAESSSGPVWSVGLDPRVTRVGRFLRDTHLDELPQLLNVLFGHMSLVGPRPERPPFVLQFREEIPFYEARVTVRPGITGLSQMRLPPDCDLDSVRRKLVHDLYYVRNVSPWLDLRILIYTLAELARSIGASLVRIVALPAPEIVEREFHPLVHQEFTPHLYSRNENSPQKAR